jgi:hypothetical protein
MDLQQLPRINMRISKGKLLPKDAPGAFLHGMSVYTTIKSPWTSRDISSIAEAKNLWQLHSPSMPTVIHKNSPDIKKKMLTIFHRYILLSTSNPKFQEKSLRACVFAEPIKTLF